MAVIIGGMYRNGTTLMARVIREAFNHYGGTDAYLKPENLEHRNFIKQSNKALKHFKGSSFKVRGVKRFIENFDFNAFDFKEMQAWDENSLVAIVNLEIRGEEFSGVFWKDTRLPLTIPFWYRVAPDAKYIIPYRRPEHAIESMHRLADKWGRFKATMPYENGLYLWETYHQRLLSWLDTNPNIHIIGVDYEDWQFDIEGVHEKLQSHLDMMVDLDVLKSIFKPTRKFEKKDCNNLVYKQLKERFG